MAESFKLPSGGIAIPFSPFKGIDLRTDPKYTSRHALLSSQNFVPYEIGTASKRKGSTSLTRTLWTDVLRVPFGLRYYKDASNRFKLVYVNKSAGDSIGSVDDSTGELTDLTGLPTLGANKQCRGTVFGETPAVYFGNDTDGIVKTTDGVSGAALTGTHIPAACYVGGPFYDRLLAWHGKRLLYSRTNLDDDWSDLITGNPQYILIQHPEDITIAFTPGPDKTEVGYMGKLYVCTPTSTWTKLLDFGTGNFTKIHERAGIASMNSAAWTDRGVIGLGTDDVWFFPVTGLPVPIGGAIKPVIEAIPAAYRYRCGAAFRNGFYKLSVVLAGQTTPSVEYWADMRGYSSSKVDHGVQWYGPMIRGNLGILAYLQQTQAPDENEIFGLSANDGRVITLEDATSYTDDGEAMESILETGDVDGNIPTVKGLTGFIIGPYSSDEDTFMVHYNADDFRQQGCVVVTTSNNGYRWDGDTSLWDTATWGGVLYEQIHKIFEDRPDCYKGRLKVVHTANQAFAIKELNIVLTPFGRIGA